MTAGIRDPAKARDIRDEVDSHLSAVIRELLEAGWSSVDAEAEALRRMGDALVVGRSLAMAVAESNAHKQRAGVVGACLFSMSGIPLLLVAREVARLGSAFIPPNVLGLLTLGSVAGVAMGTWLLLWSVSLSAKHGSIAGMWDWARSHRPILGLWAMLGVAFEIAPAFTASALSRLSNWPWETIEWAVLCVAVLLLSLREENIVASIAVFAAALWAWVIAGVLAGQAVLRIAPHPPAAFATIYTPALASWARLFSLSWKFQWVCPMATAGTIVILLVWAIRYATFKARYANRKNPATN